VVERVLFAQNGGRLQIGRPYVSDAKVICEVVEHRLGPKVISYHFRRRENWRKTVGHRQPLTRLVVKEIIFGQGAASSPAVAAEQGSARPQAAAPRKAGAPKPHAASTSTKKAVKKP
jgi:large subunit ribosomal protein L21